MNTATPKRSLRSLEQQLQQCLDALSWENFPIQIRCAIKNADLLVLAEHQDGVRPDLQKTFKAIHQAILSLSPELDGELRLYLRVMGQVQPYAYHGFQLPQPLGAVNRPGTDPNPFAAFAWLEKLIEHHGENVSPEAAETSSIQRTDLTVASENPLSLMAEALSAGREENNPLKGLEEFPSNLFNQSDAAKDVRRQRVKFPALPSRSGQLAGYLFLSMAICSVVLYGFTRPCVVGQCDTIVKADRLINEGQQTLADAKYRQHLEEVQAKFSLATQELKRIPVWSGKRFPARQLMNRYHHEANRIDEVLSAMEIGANAWQKAQNAPLPIADWRSLQTAWSEAIALLEKIPPQSQLYPFAQQKLSEYEANFQAIVRRVKIEERAAETLEKIRANADLAYTRQGVATAAESWQRIAGLWEATLDLAAQIPSETMAYAQLEELLGDYRRQSIDARERQIQEKIAQDTYNQAIVSAEEAEELTKQKEWSLALTRWTDALTYIRQVPTNTFYYPKAQNLVTSYSDARNQAAANLKTATIVQKTKNDLKKLCNGNPVVCEYTVTEDVINVWLTAAYVRKVKRTALLADRKGDRKALVGVNQHLDTLKVALQSISDNAQIPLMLYDSYGALIGRHPKN